MKIIFFISLIIATLTFVSCSEDKISQKETLESEQLVSTFSDGKVTLRNGILSFSTKSAFNEYCDKLSNNDLFRESIAKKYGDQLMISRLTDQNVDLKFQHIIENLPPSFLNVLSRDGAYILEDKYVRFGEKVNYFVDADKKDQFDWNDESSIDLSKVKSYKYGRMKNFEFTPTIGARLDIGNNEQNTGGLQHQFVQQAPNVGDKKWVDEIDAYSLTPIYDGSGIATIKCYLVFRAKLEWRGSGSWKPAGEYRYITPDITYSLSFGTSPTSATNLCTNCRIGPVCCVSTTPVTVYQNTDYNKELKIYDYRDPTGNFGSCKWYLTGTATIVHRIDGDIPANTWTSNLGW